MPIIERPLKEYVIKVYKKKCRRPLFEATVSDLKLFDTLIDDLNSGKRFIKFGQIGFWANDIEKITYEQE